MIGKLLIYVNNRLTRKRAMANRSRDTHASRVEGRAPRDGDSRGLFPPLTTTLPAFVKNGSDHEFRQLMFELNSLFNQMKRHAEHFARFIGVNPAQFTIILIIAEMPDVTVRQIAEQMNVTSPFV